MSNPRSFKFIVLIVAGTLAGFLTIYPLSAEIVSENHRGLKLNAELKMAGGKSLEDGVVLLLPSPLGHHRMEIIVSVQDVLAENGINTLAPSLSLGYDNRRWYIDCSKPIKFTSKTIFDEIDFWIDWLAERGARKVTILGHSASANYVTVYMMRRERLEVNGVVLLAPATLMYGPHGVKRYENRFKVSLKDVLTRADGYISSGEGSEPMWELTDYYFCPAAQVTANAFVSMYRDMSNQDLPTLWSRMQKPTLLIIGTGDKRSPEIIDEARRAKEYGGIEVVTIEKGGHFFKGLYTDEAVKAMIEFISKVN